MNHEWEICLLNSDTAMIWIDMIFLFLDYDSSELVQFISYGLILRQFYMLQLAWSFAYAMHQYQRLVW